MEPLIKSIVFRYVIFLSVFYTPLTQRSSANTITFSDYINMMISNNGVYKQSLEIYYANKSRSDGSIGLYFPTIDVNANRSSTSLSPQFAQIQGYDQSSSTILSTGLNGNLPQLGLDYNATVFQFSNFSSYLLGQPLQFYYQGQYNLGLRLHLLKGLGPAVGTIPFKLLTANKNAAEWKSKSTLIQLTQNLLEAYLTLFTINKRYELLEQLSHKLQVFVERFQTLEKEGRASGLEFLNTKVSFETLRTQLTQLQSQRLDAWNALNQVAGNPSIGSVPDEVQEISDEVFQIAPEWRIDIKPEDIALNPDLKALDETVKIADLESQSANNSVLPALDFYSNLTGSGQNSSNLPPLFSKQFGNSQVGIEFSMPIGLFRERAEARAKIAELEGQKDFLNQTRTQVLDTLQTMTRRLRLDEQALEFAQVTNEASQERYRTSLPTIEMSSYAQKNVLDYLAATITSQIAYYDAKVRLITTRSSLYFLRGDLTPLDRLSIHPFH